MNDSNFEYSNQLGRLDIDCDDAYGEPPFGHIPDFDEPMDTEAAEAELARLDAIQELHFQRVKKLQKLLALYKLHDELKAEGR